MAWLPMEPPTPGLAPPPPAESNFLSVIFALVDALTRISGKLANAGDRSEADAKASALLALVA